MLSLEEIIRSRARLAEWEKENSLKIQIYEQAVRKGQLLREDRQFEQSPFLLMRKIKQTRCEMCYLTGGQKYMRWKSMFHTANDKRQLVFNICSQCFLQEGKRKEGGINISSYRSMYWLAQKLCEDYQHSRRKRDCFEGRTKEKYLIFQGQLRDTLRQITKTIERKENFICRILFNELSELAESQQKTMKRIQQIILRQAQCTCKHQCCYCNNSDINGELLRVNCDYFTLKKQQNSLIQKTFLLDSVQQDFAQYNQHNIFEGILRQLQLIIIEKVQVIQKTLNQIIEKTQSFSFINSQFMQKIRDNYGTSTFNETQVTTIQCSQSKFTKDGVLNHITVDKFPNFSEQLKTIQLNHMPQQDQFRRKFKRLQKLENITVNNTLIGELLIEDTMKSQLSTPKPKDIIGREHHSSSINSRLSRDSQKDSCEFINLLDMSELKRISFNCQPNENIDFFKAIGEANIETIYWKWNICDFFSQFNEATHFPQQKNVLPTIAPSSLQLQQIYGEGKLKNLWIGECEEVGEGSNKSKQREEELQGSLRILDSDKSKIDSIVLGQFDGKSRSIDLRVLKQLQARKNIRSLMLHKIIINEPEFAKVLRSNIALQCLYINECQQLNKGVFEQIQSLSSLKKLSLIQVRKIYFTKSIRTLQVFFLQRCFGLVSEQLQILLQQCKLKALSLYECRFVDDELIRKILDKQNQNECALQYLNLGYTKLSNETLRVANRFKLRALHIGGTQIDLLQLLGDLTKSEFSSFRCLQKLSLKDMRKSQVESVSEHENDLFSFILRYFPLLSHLDLSSNTRINERAVRFGLSFLVYLKVTDTQFSSLHLNKKIEHAGSQCPYFQAALQQNELMSVSEVSSMGTSSIPKQGCTTSDLRMIF